MKFRAAPVARIMVHWLSYVIGLPWMSIDGSEDDIDRRLEEKGLINVLCSTLFFNKERFCYLKI